MWTTGGGYTFQDTAGIPGLPLVRAGRVSAVQEREVPFGGLVECRLPSRSKWL